MKEYIFIASRYLDEPIYNEDGSILENAGLQFHLREMPVNSSQIHLISHMNSAIERIFTSTQDLQLQIDALVMTYMNSGILEYYEWLLSYMSYSALVFLQSADSKYNDQISAILESSKLQNQKVK